jgi:hypothetical protein
LRRVDGEGLSDRLAVASEWMSRLVFSAEVPCGHCEKDCLRNVRSDGETNAVDRLSEYVARKRYAVNATDQGCQRSGHHKSSTEDKLKRNLLVALAAGAFVPAIAAAHNIEVLAASCIAESDAVIVKTQASFFPFGDQSATYTLVGLDAAGNPKTVVQTASFQAPGDTVATILSPGIAGLASVSKVTVTYTATDGVVGTVTADVNVTGCAPKPVVVTPPVVTPVVVTPAPSVTVPGPSTVVVVATPTAPVVVGTPNPPVVVKGKTTSTSTSTMRACATGVGKVKVMRTVTTYPNGKKRVTLRQTGRCASAPKITPAVTG